MFDLLLVALVASSYAVAPGYADLCERVLPPIATRQEAA
jgi:hypothetical protein